MFILTTTDSLTEVVTEDLLLMDSELSTEDLLTMDGELSTEGLLTMDGNYQVRVC